MCIPCILIPLLVGLISAILGYLLGKLLSKGNDNSDDLRIQLGNLTKDRDKHLSLSNSLSGDVDSWKTKFGKGHSRRFVLQKFKRWHHGQDLR